MTELGAPPVPPAQFLKLGTVAFVLNVSEPTARRMLRKRIIGGAVKVGRSWRLPPDRLTAYLDDLAAMAAHGTEASYANH